MTWVLHYLISIWHEFNITWSTHCIRSPTLHDQYMIWVFSSHDQHLTWVFHHMISTWHKFYITWSEHEMSCISHTQHITWILKHNSSTLNKLYITRWACDRNVTCPKLYIKQFVYHMTVKLIYWHIQYLKCKLDKGHCEERDFWILWNRHSQV